MNPEHIADSYDFVKRTLLSVKPGGTDFIAVPMYTSEPSDTDAESYRTFLAVELVDPLLQNAPEGDRATWLHGVTRAMMGQCRHIFLDPDTGIRLPPVMPKGAEARRYVGADEVDWIVSRNPEILLLCFDQSLDRRTVQENRSEKLRYFGRKDVWAVYFKSHASILAASKNRGVLHEWVDGVKALGVPEWRLHRQETLEPGPPLPE